MAFYLTKPINIPLGRDVNDVRDRLCRLLRLTPRELKSVLLHRQSIDARDKSDVHFVCSYVVDATRTPTNATPYAPPLDVLESVPSEKRGSCIVVGAGPAGLFAALYLVRAGFSVTVVERGSDVDRRTERVREYFDGGEFDPECNVQFGLGGAGTFSDGKLTSGISSPLTFTVLSQLVRCGAPRDILTDSLPHVGTDRLRGVVAGLRDGIAECGGTFMFDTCVTDFVVRDGTVTGVVTDSGELNADHILLACGHSARDIFARLQQLGADISFKPFAVGVRIEHTREFIDSAQYGSLFATHRDLPAATYKLVYNGEHSCYSFCMCPGGVVVAANSEPNTVVVNGMSDYARDAVNSNSALVVNVTAEDVAAYGFGTDALAGVRFQRSLEHAAYYIGGDYRAPVQNVSDFLAGRVSRHLDVTPSYPRGTVQTDLNRLLPEPVSRTLKEALYVFDGKIKGFGGGVLTGVESRTSSPVRVLRNDFVSNLAHLYPIGEGAGYAGGIVSSAVDGLRTAMHIAGFR